MDGNLFLFILNVKICCSGLVMTWLISLSILGCNWSGPRDLDVFSIINFFLILSSVKTVSCSSLFSTFAGVVILLLQIRNIWWRFCFGFDKFPELLGVVLHLPRNCLLVFFWCLFRLLVYFISLPHIFLVLLSRAGFHISPPGPVFFLNCPKIVIAESFHTFVWFVCNYGGYVFINQCTEVLAEYFISFIGISQMSDFLLPFNIIQFWCHVYIVAFVI